MVGGLNSRNRDFVTGRSLTRLLSCRRVDDDDEVLIIASESTGDNCTEGKTK